MVSSQIQLLTASRESWKTERPAIPIISIDGQPMETVVAVREALKRLKTAESTYIELLSAPLNQDNKSQRSVLASPSVNCTQNAAHSSLIMNLLRRRITANYGQTLDSQKVMVIRLLYAS